MKIMAKVMELTIVPMACTGALVDEDGHELIVSLALGSPLKLTSAIHAQQRCQIQLQGEGQLVARFDFSHFLRAEKSSLIASSERTGNIDTIKLL